MPSSLAIVLVLAAATFAWQAFSALARGSTKLPISMLSVEEFDRDSICFWGVLGLNVLLAVLCIGLAVMVYLNNWDALPLPAVS
jgi:hypothetical protein